MQNGLAMQSFCLRGFKTNEEVIAKLKACGVAGVELCGVHVDFADAATHDQVIRLYQDAGIRIVSIGVNGFSADEAAARNSFDFARAAGCKVVSANFSPDGMWDAFRTAEKLADEYDINLGIHNHGGYHWLGSTQMLKYIFANTSPRIGLMLDTAWAIDAKQDPVEMARTFADRLYGVHAKDFVYNRERKHEDVVVGTGILDLPGLFGALRETGFDGELILEYEGDVNNPVPALKECVAAIEQERK